MIDAKTLDELLGTSPKNKANPVINYQEPSTFEEWCKIHGDPEYVIENEIATDFCIDIIDCTSDSTEQDQNLIGLEECVYVNEKGKKIINYPKTVAAFAQANQCVFCNGIFYSPEGALTSRFIRQEISHSLEDAGWIDKLDIPTNSIFNSLKDMYSVDELPVNKTVIPFANGDLHLSEKGNWSFRLGEKQQTAYRLSVNYTPRDAPMPMFEKWLRDIFVEEDIRTIQEILGYCLVPVTSVQEAFFLVGDAGVGKSIMGHIFSFIWGNSYEEIKTQDVVTQRFHLAMAENKLVLYDDDLGAAALTETGTLKKLITANQKITAERKFEQPHSFIPYCKIVASANFMLSSLYDDSDGFYRRLHPILVKPKDPNRKNIKDFEKLIELEKEQIVRWALAGLKRLMDNKWEITWSKRSSDYMGSVKNNGVHFPEFLEETTIKEADSDTSCAELRKVYERWCKANNIQDVRVKRMQTWLAGNAEKEQFVLSRNVVRDGKQVRGYKGLKIKSEWNPGHISL